MKKLIPLYYAILKHYMTVDEACSADVIEALKGDYGSYKMLKPAAVLEAIMTAEKNGLLDESRFDADESGNLRTYYKVNDYGKQMITTYIGKYNND